MEPAGPGAVRSREMTDPHGQAGAFSWKRFALVHVYGLFVHLFIVFANDAADWRADLGNKTYNVFSGGSRVVPEGKLTPRQLANGAMLMALGIGAIGAVAGFIERLPFAVVLAALPLGILWAYSFPPFRLSYRGNGEVLQALGVGVVLPLTAFYYQAGTFAPLHLASIVPTALLGYAGNVTTALPDTPADRATGKHHLLVRWPSSSESAQRASRPLASPPRRCCSVSWRFPARRLGSRQWQPSLRPSPSASPCPSFRTPTRARETRACVSWCWWREPVAWRSSDGRPQRSSLPD